MPTSPPKPIKIRSFTTPSTFNATWSPDPPCVASELRPLYNGKPQSQLHKGLPSSSTQCVLVRVAVTKPVIFIARGPHLQAIRTTGLRLDTPVGEIVIV